MRNLSSSVVIILVVGMFMPAQADDLDNIGALDQQQFGALAEDVNAVIAYRATQPAEPLGMIGFDVSVEASVIDVENRAAWSVAANDDVSSVPLARVSVNKGLPLNFDVGAFYATAPGSNISLLGGQLRYALVEGGVVAPAVGVRAAVTRLQGVDDLDAETRSLDLSISKGFGPLTPYVGYGRVWGDFTPSASTGLSAVDRDENRAFAGLRFSMLVLQVHFEAEQMGDRTGYSAKFGFGF